MISINDAYKIIREQTDYPLDSLYENDKFIIGGNSMIYLLDKQSQKISIELEWLAISLDVEHLVPIFLQELYDDFLNYYSVHNDEEHLAEQYATVWNHVYWNDINEKDEEMYEGDFERVAAKWAEIEKEVYKKIRNIMEHEDFYYPPCVLDKMDDPFYRIKPFMLKNGYTVDIHEKIWVKK